MDSALSIVPVTPRRVAPVPDSITVALKGMIGVAWNVAVNSSISLKVFASVAVALIVIHNLAPTIAIYIVEFAAIAHFMSSASQFIFADPAGLRHLESCHR